MKKYLGFFVMVVTLGCTKEILTHKLSTDASPLNGGSVTPPSNSFEHGQQVSLTATPNGEYVFKNWQGALSGTTNPTSLLMDADKQVTGVFEKRQYPLNLTIEGNGTVKEEVIAMASQAQYPSGTTVNRNRLGVNYFNFQTLFIGG
jgi:Divergent InlB B-repeat domain